MRISSLESLGLESSENWAATPQIRRSLAKAQEPEASRQRLRYLRLLLPLAGATAFAARRGTQGRVRAKAKLGAARRDGRRGCWTWLLGRWFELGADCQPARSGSISRGLKSRAKQLCERLERRLFVAVAFQHRKKGRK